MSKIFTFLFFTSTLLAVLENIVFYSFLEKKIMEMLVEVSEERYAVAMLDREKIENPVERRDLISFEARELTCFYRYYCSTTFIRLREPYDGDRVSIDLGAHYYHRGYRPLAHWTRLFTKDEDYGSISGGGVAATLSGGRVVNAQS